MAPNDKRRKRQTSPIQTNRGMQRPPYHAAMPGMLYPPATQAVMPYLPAPGYVPNQGMSPPLSNPGMVYQLPNQTMMPGSPNPRVMPSPQSK